MKLTTMLSVAVALLYIANCYVRRVFKAKGDILKNAVEYIALAEESGLKGPEKMYLVVDSISSEIPWLLKQRFAPERVQTLVQNTFEWMQRYADAWSTDEKFAKTETTNIENNNSCAMAASQITELLNLTVPELKKRAAEYGIEIDGLTRKNEIVRAMVEAVLTKA